MGLCRRLVPEGRYDSLHSRGALSRENRGYGAGATGRATRRPSRSTLLTKTREKFGAPAGVVSN